MESLLYIYTHIWNDLAADRRIHRQKDTHLLKWFENIFTCTHTLIESQRTVKKRESVKIAPGRHFSHVIIINWWNIWTLKWLKLKECDRKLVFKINIRLILEINLFIVGCLVEQLLEQMNYSKYIQSLANRVRHFFMQFEITNK